ncbi:hypothetical protein BBW65_00630 [Helicobacter enhydrae]|uniref:Uncharacterized protein n=1 Tax=Helicobacter enhydrae TaxID=222136 RepID=A0A1B1U3W1_9HELI|nr:hypothetical protein [Helicobacter enhydrae]ANV97412.1 hypothetical protein BBW65_00630 [Helicobacter enhydrae]
MSKKIKNQIKIGNNNKIVNSNFGTYNQNEKLKKESIPKTILIGVIIAVIGGVIVGIIMEYFK